MGLDRVQSAPLEGEGVEGGFGASLLPLFREGVQASSRFSHEGLWDATNEHRVIPYMAGAPSEKSIAIQQSLPYVLDTLVPLQRLCISKLGDVLGHSVS